MPEVLEKVRTLRTLVSPQTLISIDGGIAGPTIASAAEAGCQIFVAGSSIFDETDYRSAIDQLTQLAAAATSPAPENS